MGKLLSWVILIALIYVVYKFIVISRRKQQSARGSAAPDGAEAKPGNELMLRCDQCGIHVPASEAVNAAGKHYCSIAHRDIDRAAGDGNDEHSG